MRVLVIDVGGTHIKVAGSWDRITEKIPSGPTMTAADMVRSVLALTQTWDYEAVSLGYPGPVKENRPMREPINIAGGWTTFDFQKAFGKPVRIINDAAMQALGSYAGGRMLFLGLGTGLGTSIVDNWRVEPLEIAHLPYRKGLSYEDYLGEQGLQKLGDRRWERHVHRVCDLFRAALLCDGIVLGGGNARKLVDLPDAATRGANENAIQGGVRLWERVAESMPPEFIDAKTASETIVGDALLLVPATRVTKEPVALGNRGVRLKRGAAKSKTVKRKIVKRSPAKRGTTKRGTAKKSAVRKVKKASTVKRATSKQNVSRKSATKRRP